MMSGIKKKEERKTSYKNLNLNRSRKLKYNRKMQNETYQVIIIPEGVQDLGGSQMALKTQAGNSPANDNCPNGVGAGGKITPPQ